MNTEYLKSLFDYDPKRGELIWKVSRGARAKIGYPAGYKQKNRYVSIRLDGKVLYAHRLIWLWHGMELPEIIDHINCDKYDNRIENLRAATPSQSQCNHRKRVNNTSGAKGVSWSKKARKWQARIQVNNKQKWLGQFKSKYEAISVADKARQLFHGEFSRHA